MKQRHLLLCLAGLSLLFFMMGNSLLPITDPVESNYALTAKEMVLSGDWISPQIYGVFWYDKPIVIYWLLSAAYSLFGFTDFASRLPSAIFGTASVVLLAWYVLRQSKKIHAALLAAAMLATSLEVWVVSHAIVTDQMLFFFSSATMLFAYIGLTENRRSYVAAAYAMAAFAVLTKGPVGLVLPGLFLLIFAGCQRNLSYVKRLFPLSGLALFCLIALPWYGTMYALHGQDFIDGFLGLNNVVRATVSEHPKDNVWYYYIVLVPVSLLPWTGPCLYALWKRRCRKDPYMYLVIWTLGTVLFYSLMATKYPTYSYIANMPLILLGCRGILDIYYSGRRKLWLILTAPVVLYWLLLTGATFALAWGNWVWLYLFVPPAIALLLAAQWQRAYTALPVLAAIGTMVIYMIILPQGLAPFVQNRSTESSIEAAKTITGPLYFFGDYQTSFVYYTDKPAVFIGNTNRRNAGDNTRGQAWNGKYLYQREEISSIQERLARQESIFIFVTPSYYEDFQSSPLASQTIPAGKYGRLYLYKART